jgi:hypothetical protein
MQLRSPSRPPGTKPSPPTWPGWPACTALPQANCGTGSAVRSPAPAGAATAEFLQVTSLITADIFIREIPGGTRARHRSRPG